MKKVQFPNFLKLKPSVFMGEDVNEDPQWFLDGSEKACVALGCSSVRRVDLVTYRLHGKADEWWTTWKVGRSLDFPPVTWEEFKQVIMDFFISRSM